MRVRAEHRGDAAVEPRASATFSLVASAWTSTRTTGVVARASSTSPSTISHMLRAGSRKSEPRRLIDRDRRAVAGLDDRRARGPGAGAGSSRAGRRVDDAR